MQGPQLKYFQQFKVIIDNYAVSERAKRATKDLKLVLLLAPTSGGKNTIIRYQLSTGRYYFIVSDTTRPPRVNNGVKEKNGREYWFRSEEEMLADLQAGELLEAEIIHNQQVSGISIRELEKAQAAGKIAITDVDLLGVRNILRVKPDTIVITLVPPSFAEWQKRLTSRGQMSPTEHKRRLTTAYRLFNIALANDYQLIVTDDVAESGRVIDNIVSGQPNPQQARGRRLVQQLQKALEETLGKTN